MSQRGASTFLSQNSQGYAAATPAMSMTRNLRSTSSNFRTTRQRLHTKQSSGKDAMAHANPASPRRPHICATRTSVPGTHMQSTARTIWIMARVRRAQRPNHTTTRTRMLITNQGQARAWRHLCPRYLHVPGMGPGDMRLGEIVGAGEGAMITGRIITASVDAAAAVDVDEAEGILPTGQKSMGPDRYHPPRRSSHRQWDNPRYPMLAAVPRTICHTPLNYNNLALHNRIRRRLSRSCRHNIQCSHISIHDSRDSLVY